MSSAKQHASEGEAQIPNATQKAITFALIAKDRRLSHGAVRLFLLLNTYCNKFGQCYPGQRRLLAELGSSWDSIRPWFLQLKHCGYLDIARPKFGRGRLYTLRFIANGTVSTTANGTVSDDRQRNHEHTRCTPVNAIPTKCTPLGAGQVAKRNADTAHKRSARSSTSGRSLTDSQIRTLGEKNDMNADDIEELLDNARAGKVGRTRNLVIARAEIKTGKRVFDGV